MSRILLLKSLVILSFLFCLSFAGWAQGSLDGMKYQAIIRDASGNVVGNKAIGLKFIIYQKSNPAVYEEEHTVQTNQLGLVNLEIGVNSAVIVGDFKTIDWSVGEANAYYILVQLDLQDGNGFQDIGESKLLTTPYSQFAKSALTAVDDYDRDSTNEYQVLSASNDTVFLSKGGGFFVFPTPLANHDNDSTNELNTGFTFLNDTLKITDAGGERAADLSSLDESADVTFLQGRIQNLSDSMTVAYDSVNSYNNRINQNTLDMGLNRITTSNLRSDFSADSLALVNYINAVNDSSKSNELNTAVIFRNDSVIVSDAGGEKGTSVSGLNQSSDIAALQSRAGNLSDSLSDAYDSLAVHRTDLNNNQGNIATNLTSIGNLSSRIGTDSTNLANFIAAMKDSSTTNEIQVLSISNDTIYLDNGGQFAVLPAAVANLDNDSTNEKITSLFIRNDSLIVDEAGIEYSTDLSQFIQATPRLDSVLAAGNNAGNDSITNLKSLAIGSNSTNGNALQVDGGSVQVNHQLNVDADAAGSIANMDAVSINATGATNANRSLVLTTNESNTENNTGMYSLADSARDWNIGIRGDGVGYDTSIVYGVYGQADGTTNFIKRGVVGVLIGTVDGNNDAAVYGIANGVGQNIALYGRASNGTNSGDTNIAILGDAQNGAVNMSGWFKNGNVYVDDTLYLKNGAQANYVLTSDVNGRAEWKPSNFGNDNDSTNELITSFTLSNDSIIITEGGITQVLVLSSVVDTASFNAHKASMTASLAGLSSRIIADSTALQDHIAAMKDSSTTNEIQVLSLSNDTIYLDNNGGFVVLPAAAINLDNDSTNEKISSVIMLNDTTIQLNESGKLTTISIAGLGNTVYANRDSIDQVALDLDDVALDLADVETLLGDTASYLQDSIDVVAIDVATVASDLASHEALDTDLDSTNEIQVLSISNDTIYLDNNGGFVVLPAGAVNLDNDSTNEKISSVTMLNDTTIQLDENGQLTTISIAGLGNTVYANSDSIDVVAIDLAGVASDLASHESLDTDLDSTNEIQVLSISNDTIYLDNNGGFVVLPAGAVNLDNDSTNEKISSVTMLNDTTIQLDENGQLTTISIAGLGNTVYANRDSIDQVVLDLDDVALDLDDVETLLGDTASYLQDSLDVVALDVATVVSDLASHEALDTDLDSTNEIQVLSLSNDTIYLDNNGGFVVLPAGAVNLDNDSTNEKISAVTMLNDTTIQLDENGQLTTISIAGLGNTVYANRDSIDQVALDLDDVALDVDDVETLLGDTASYLQDSIDVVALDVANVASDLASHEALDTDLDSTNEIQVLSLSNDTIYLDNNGGFVVLPAGAVNLDNDSTNEKISAVTMLNDTTIQLDENGKLTTISIAGLGNTVYANRDSIDVVASNLSSLEGDLAGHVAADNDLDSTNELIISGALSGTDLEITDAGGITTVDLISLDESSEIATIYTKWSTDSTDIYGALDDTASAIRSSISSMSASSLDSVLAAGNDAGGDSIVNLAALKMGNTPDSASLQIRTNKEFSMRIYNENSSSTEKKSIFGSTVGGGSGNNFGLYGGASSSSGNNYGLYGLAEGSAGTKYGVYGDATGSSGTKYAIFGTATGGATSNNYAGFFDQGKVFIGDDLGIGILNPSFRVDILGDLYADSIYTDSLYAVIAQIDSLTIAESYGLPTYDGNNLDVLQTDGSGNVDWVPIPGADTLSLIIDSDRNTGIGVDITTDNIDFFQMDTTFFRMNRANLEALNNGSSVFMGENAGDKDDYSDNRNVFVGYSAGQNNTTGNNNVYMGYDAGRNGTTGALNVYLGPWAGKDATASNNVGIGFNTLVKSTGNDNVAIGISNSLAATSATKNIGIGSGGFASLTSGEGNISIGYGAGSGISTQHYNVVMGLEAMRLGNGSRNIVLGKEAARSLVGNNNSIIGTEAAELTTSGSSNVLMGYRAGYSASTLSNNVMLGYQAGQSSTSTSLSSNVFIGYRAGYVNKGSSNVFIGSLAGSAESGSNLLYIDNSAATTPLIYGDFSLDSLQFNGKVNVTGGFYVDKSNGAAGKVLTSDANGMGTWETFTVPGSIWDTNSTTAYLSDPKFLAIGSNDSAFSQFQIDSTFHFQSLELSGAMFGLMTTNITADGSGTVYHTVDGAGSAVIMTEGSIQMATYANNTAASNAFAPVYMVLDTIGLGINTSAPTATLDIDGDALIDGQVEITDTLTYKVNAGADRVLASDANGAAVWKTLSSLNTCPSGMVDVNGSYCIETSERTAAIWFVADSVCTDAGYELATYGDWYGAATEAAAGNISLTDMEDDWEWTSNFSQNNAMVVGDPTSGLGRRQRAFRDPESSTAVYRCVKKL